MKRLRQRLLLALLAPVIALCLLEGALSLVWLGIDFARFRHTAKTAQDSKDNLHCRHDPDLGWRHIPGKRIPDFYGAGRNLTINSNGFRGPELPPAGATGGLTRVVFLGDSFTFGFGVDDRDTFPARLAAINPALQTVNLGHVGYSLGQFYQLYQQHADRLEADRLIVALVIDDLWRMSRPRTPTGYANPVFRLDRGTIRSSGRPLPAKVATGRPIREFGRTIAFLSSRSALCRTFARLPGPIRSATRTAATPEGDAIMRLSFAVLDRIRAIAAEHGTQVVLVLFPEQRELVNPTMRNAYHAVANLFRDYARRQRIRFIDLYPHVTRQGIDASRRYYDPNQEYHFSVEGNRLVARTLNSLLFTNE